MCGLKIPGNHMSYSLNSLESGYLGDSIGDYYGDTGSLDYSPHGTTIVRQGGFLA